MYRKTDALTRIYCADFFIVKKSRLKMARMAAMEKSERRKLSQSHILKVSEVGAKGRSREWDWSWRASAKLLIKVAFRMK